MIWSWIASGGGPLIVVPTSAVGRWSGTEAPPDRVVEASFRWEDEDAPASDYDFACDVVAPLEVRPWLDVEILVLGDEPTMTAWCPRLDGGLLVRWIGAESEQDVHRLVEAHGALEEGDAVPWAVPGPCSLFDSAIEGPSVADEPHETLALAPGAYEVRTRLLEDPERQTAVWVHRVRRLG